MSLRQFQEHRILASRDDGYDARLLGVCIAARRSPREHVSLHAFQKQKDTRIRRFARHDALNDSEEVSKRLHV